jgi:hypothetical protein
VYVVVEAGETAMLPEVGCDPIPLSIVTDVAFVVDHVNVEDWPAAMLPGLDVKEMVGGCELLETVTVAVADDVPPGPLAVRV